MKSTCLATTQGPGELQERHDTLLARKRGGLEVYPRNRMQRAQSWRDHATNELIVRMKESELARIQHEYETTRRDLEQRRNADILSHRVAAGVLLVQGEVPNA